MRRVAWIVVVAAVMALAGAQAAGAKPVIELDVSQGLFIQPYHLVIEPGGAAVVDERSGPRRFRIPRPAVRQIRQLAKRMHFASFRSYYGPAGATDQPTYAVTYGGRTVRTECCSPPAPVRLWTLITQLSQMADDGAHPPLLRLVAVTRKAYVSLIVRRDGTVTTNDGTRHVSSRCVGRVRAALRALPESKLRIGTAPRLARNRAMLEITHAYRSFHSWLDRRHPRQADHLIRLARRIAAGHC